MTVQLLQRHKLFFRLVLIYTASRAFYYPAENESSLNRNVQAQIVSYTFA